MKYLEDDEPTLEEKKAAFLAGYVNALVYGNPYKDDTAEARVYVDGWVEGLREYGPR